MLTILRQLPSHRVPRPIKRAENAFKAKTAILSFIRAHGRGQGGQLPFDEFAIDTDEPVMIVPLVGGGESRFFVYTEVE